MTNKNKRLNFESVLQMVQEEPERVFERHARMLSDLTREKAEKLRTILDGMAPGHRAAFFNAMKEAGMEYLECNFAPIAEIGLDDEDGNNRAAAISILGLEEDSREVGEKMLYLAENDPDEKAQIAAVDILGQYMFEETLEEHIPVSGKKLHEILEKLIEHKNEAVRRAAVISYAISETKRVNEIISAYLAGSDPEELITGLSAVRISLNENHAKSVLELINSDNEDVAVEAVRTAGALRLREALPAVYEIISRFDRISPAMLYAAVNAAAEIGDEASLDVLETLGEAALDMDEEITEFIDDSIDTLNMEIYIGLDDDEADEKESRSAKRSKAMLNEAIEAAKDRCLSILEEKIPHDLEDDEAFDLYDEDEDVHDHGHDHDGHHHHHHENPMEGLDLSRFRILEDLEAYESAAHHDADEEELWAEFENLAEEDLDADSLQDFINKLEAKKKKKK